jgi:NAD(P)-dependent dehydrogenase (short-subunit alcohol dehydrogenase family)
MSRTYATDDATLLADPPTLRLDGKVAWVTGASRGLGRSLAFALAGAGADVLLSARSEAPLEATAEEIRAAGGVAETAVGSVDDPAAVAATAERIASRWGRLDVLVNNAGISPSYTRSERLADEDWRSIIDINLTGPFLCVKAAFPLLVEAGGGSVINVSSVHGRSAGARMLAYTASKGGIEMITRTLAVEWAPRGIRVNSVAPGYLETEMTTGLREHERISQELLGRIPLGRFGTTSEVASAVLFLAADVSSYVTGATLAVDGGWTAQ